MDNFKLFLSLTQQIGGKQPAGKHLFHAGRYSGSGFKEITFRALSTMQRQGLFS